MSNSEPETHSINTQVSLGVCPASPTQRRVALVCGGTAGHIYPALAMAEAYRQARADIDILFIGTATSFEARLIPACGYPFRAICASKLFGVRAWGKAQTMINLLRGIFQSRRLLHLHKSQLVVGFGGYATAGPLLAARSLGLYTAIHESNIVPGLTNRFLGRMVDRVYLGFAAASSPFAAGRTIITGNPVRSDISKICKPKPPRALQRPYRILITGGSQGSAFLNGHAPDLLSRVRELGIGLEIWHQIGQHDPGPIRRAYADLGLTSTVTPYIDTMASAYEWADFAITCSGASTIAELSACGLPALLVPLTHVAADHQRVNAESFAQTGAAWWVSEADWQPSMLAKLLAALLADPDRRFRASVQARLLTNPNAAHTLVTACEALMSPDA